MSLLTGNRGLNYETLFLFFLFLLFFCEQKKAKIEDNEILEEKVEDAFFEDFFEEEISQCPKIDYKGKYISKESIVEFKDQGINKWEKPYFEILAEALLKTKSIYMVDTYLNDEKLYLVRTKEGEIKFKRIFTENGVEFEIKEKKGKEIFPCVDPKAFSTIDEELKQGGNPEGTFYPEYGYEKGDERLSFIEPENHCYPFPFLRVSQLYDSTNAPDFHYSLTPYGGFSIGIHGNLDVIQSRAPLVFSGPGIKKGIYDKESLITDIAPTVLALLGAKPEPGIKMGLSHSSTLLKWQDGDVLDEIFEEDCQKRPERTVIFLFDGLSNSEVLYQWDKCELKTFCELMNNGAVFKYGSIVGLPSISLPGHLTVGTGVLPGHHWFIANGMYLREEKQLLNPQKVFENINELIKNPLIIKSHFEKLFNPDAETIFEAVHRHFSEQAFTASINEPTIGGADYTIMSLLMPNAKAQIYSSILSEIDSLAVLQIKTLIESKKIPKVAFISFYSTDEAGEESGPHGDNLREILKKMDSHINEIIELYKKEGLFEQTLFVITADHGMEIQDLNRSDNWSEEMKKTEIKFIDADNYGAVFILAMRAECSVTEDGENVKVQITAKDDDTNEGVEGATVEGVWEECKNCKKQTNKNGEVIFIFNKHNLPEKLNFKITSESFNDLFVECG